MRGFSFLAILTLALGSCFSSVCHAAGPAVVVGGTGVLFCESGIIDVRTQSSIQRAAENGNAGMKLHRLIARLVELNEITRDAKTTPVSGSLRAMSDLVKAESAHDSDGVANLLIDGEVFVVANGTRVRVIDGEGNGSVSKVRILNGPMQGKAGYVPAAWVGQ
jgi:hypothetical protein